MKLWTTVDILRLPEILKNGFDNPYAEELVFYSFPDLVAETALSLEGELAFLEAEVPDERVDEYFGPCLGLYGDDATNAAIHLEEMAEAGEDADLIESMRKNLQAMEEAETGRQGLEAYGYACLVEVLPPDMMKLLDPEKTMEAMASGDAEFVASTIENTEGTALKSLGAAFWVWLMMLIGQIMGPGYGQPAEEGAEESAKDIAERARARARGKSAKPKRKRKPRAKKATT